MSFAANEFIGQWETFPTRTVYGNVLPAGQRLFKGSLCVVANGKVYPASDFTAGKPIAAIPLQVPAAVGPGVMGVYAKQQNVRYQQAQNGLNTPLSVQIGWLPGNTSIDVIVNLATDGAGAVTSTMATVMQAIWANGVASKLLGVYQITAGTGISAATSTTSVPYIGILGIAEDTYDNLAGVSDLTVKMGFTKGFIQLVGLATDLPTQAMLSAEVAVVDNVTVKATVSSGDLTLPLANVTPEGAIFCWLK